VQNTAVDTPNSCKNKTAALWKNMCAEEQATPVDDFVVVQKFQSLENLARVILNDTLGERSKYVQRFRY
jgi:hypothetical protein